MVQHPLRGYGTRGSEFLPNNHHLKHRAIEKVRAVQRIQNRLFQDSKRELIDKMISDYSKALEDFLEWRSRNRLRRRLFAINQIYDAAYQAIPIIRARRAGKRISLSPPGSGRETDSAATDSLSELLMKMGFPEDPDKTLNRKGQRIPIRNSA